MSAFDVGGPLPTGVTVLEASAGTGKTYTIAALAARYVAEGTRLRDLLLVTFTRMATGELRERVRDRLVAVERGLETGVSDDEIVGLLSSGDVALANGVLVSLFRLNAIVATIGVNALLYGAVFAVSGGVPKTTTTLLAAIADGQTFWLPNAVYFALAALVVVSFILKKSVAGRRFEAVGANPLATRAAGLRVQLHQLLAYVYAQLLYCMAGVLIAGITREPTAFQGDSLLLPSVAVVVLGGTSLLGGRGFPISTVIAAFFLNQLSQFALAVGVPYSAQTIIQALALGFGIGVYSVRWTVNVTRQPKPA